MRPFHTPPKVRLTLPLALVLALSISACVPKDRVTEESSHSIKPQQVALGQMDTGFLYLAAQDAINNGKIGLAIRFLDALVIKDPHAYQPRLQLAEMLLLRSQFATAQKHADIILADSSVSELLKTGAQMLRARIFASIGKKGKALNEIHSLLLKHPDLLAARLLEIRILIQDGQIEAAHTSIREALKQSPNPEIYRLLAQIYLRQGELDQAEGVLLKLLHAAPNDERAALMLSNLAIRQGNLAKAEIILTDFLRNHPRSTGVSNSLGQLLVQQHRINEAIKIYQTLASVTGESANVMMTLGLLYYQSGSFHEAEKLFRQSLAKQPENSLNHFYLAASLEALGRDQEASRIYKALGPEDKNYIQTQLRLASIAVRQEKLEQAAQRLTKLLQQHSNLADAYIMQSSIRLKQEKFKVLLKETEPALGLKVLSPAILFNRAVAYESLRDYTSMETTLRRLLAIEPANADALNFLGYSLAERGLQLEESERMVVQALKIKPGDPYYTDSLAWIYFQQARYKKALAQQRKALKKLSSDPVITEHLGDILWKTGDTEGARKAWRRAIKLKHEQPQKLKKKISNGI